MPRHFVFLWYISVYMDASKGRDRTLDIMRGLAIFLMVQGNLAGAVFPPPYPIWGKAYVAIGSFVPALFMLVAGMMVAYTAEQKGYTLKHFLLRALGLFVTGAVILEMFIWGIVPLLAADILYTIAIALPLTYLFLQLGGGWRWVLVVSVFLAGPILQQTVGYTPYPTEYSLTGTLSANAVYNETNVLQHWFVDGWFPLFPWVGFALLGANLAVGRWRGKVRRTFARGPVIAAGAGLLLFGVSLWSVYGGPLYIRGGFTELIYPPTLAYIATALGEIILLFALVDATAQSKLYQPLKVFGGSALFLYWFHYGLIELVPPHPPLPILLGMLAAMVIITLSAAYLMRYVRMRWKDRPAVVRYVLGV